MKCRFVGGRISLCRKNSALGKSYCLVMLLLVSQALGTVAWAKAYQSHESIRQAVTHFVASELSDSQNVQAVVGKLDNRLRLKQCGQELEAFWPPGARMQGRGSIGVRCDDAKPWRMFVRVEIKIFKDVLVLKAPKVRGESLEMNDVRFERKEVTRLGDRYLTDVSLVSGYTLKRAVKAGTLLHLRMLKVPHAVKRGEKVTIVADSGGIKVKMRGQALSDGKKGAVIKVRNLSSNRIVEGEVVGKGTVKIRF